MRILLGTTNPSKIRRFTDLLQEYDVQILTLQDLCIVEEPEETGKTPAENAALKALFYGAYFDRVICEDSGLFFRSLPMDDPRQPGLHIRSPQGTRLEDEEMIAYYADLVKSLGGRQLAAYVDGVAICDCGTVKTFLHDPENEGFWMVDMVHPARHPGWPLDSISIDRYTGRYFVDPDPQISKEQDPVVQESGYRRQLAQFLADALKLKKK